MSRADGRGVKVGQIEIFAMATIQQRFVGAGRAHIESVERAKKEMQQGCVAEAEAGTRSESGVLEVGKSSGAGDEGRCIIMGIDISAISQEQENADEEERRQRLEGGALRALRECLAFLRFVVYRFISNS